MSNIKNHDEKKHYEYNGIQFLTNTKKCSKLVVLFHGGRCGAKLPIFRGYNYFFKDANVMSISDPTYERYQKINVAWYFNTKKYSTLRDDIAHIIREVCKVSETTNILFVAQCSGAMIASYLGAIFKQHVLITNPHLILKSIDTKSYVHFREDAIKNGYFFNLQTHIKIPTFLGEIQSDGNDMITTDDYDIRKTFNKHGFPKKYTIYAHKDDYTAEWIKKVKEHCDNNNVDCNIVLHNTKTSSPHHCPLPNNGNLQSYISRYITNF